MYHLHRQHLWFDYCLRYTHMMWVCLCCINIWKTQWEIHIQLHFFSYDGISLHYISYMKNNNHSHFENVLLYLCWKLVSLYTNGMCHTTISVVLIKIRSLRNDLLAVGGPNWYKKISSSLSTFFYVCVCVCCSLFPSFSFETICIFNIQITIDFYHH